MSRLSTSTLYVIVSILIGLFSAPALAQTAATVANGVDALGGFTSLRLTSAHQFTRTISDRFTASRYELRITPSVPDPDSNEEALPPVAVFDLGPGVQNERFGAWAEAAGVRSTLDGSAITNEINGWIYGGNFGFDHRMPLDIRQFAGDLRVGGAVGYDHISFDTGNAGVTRGWADEFQMAGFASWSTRHLYAGLMARYTYTSMRTQRIVTVGTTPVDIEGSPNGNGAGTHIEVGGLVGDPAVIAFRPMASFDYAWIGQSAFSETGGGTSDLGVAELSTSSMVTTLGFELSRIYAYDATMFDGGPEGEFGIEPEIHVAWSHEFGDRGRHIDVTPSSGSAYRVPGAESRRDYFTVGAGYVMRFQERSLLSMHYDARLERGRIDHALRLALLFHW